MYSVYILFSKGLDKYYVGHTDNLEKRVMCHNRGGSRYTRVGIPWKLMYYEEFQTRSDAMHRELEIKKRKSRKYIEGVISNA